MYPLSFFSNSMLFSSDPPMYDDDVIDSPTRTLPRGRRDPSNPASALGRVCPPDGQSHRPLEIAFNITGGPVQVIQVLKLEKSQILINPSNLMSSNLLK